MSLPTTSLPAASASPGSSHAALGIALMLAGVLLFSMNDVLGKWLVASYPVGQVVLVKSAAAVLVLLPFLKRGGTWHLFHRGRVGIQVLRVLFSTVEIMLFYWAVVSLPLVDVMTYYLAAPIYVAALSPLLLGERIGWRRWTAILTGFLGVLIALKPSAAALTWPALISVAGSVAFALMLVTGRMLRATPDVSLVFWPTLGALLAGLATAPIAWVSPAPGDLVLLGLLGVVSMVAHVCVNRSLKLADAATVTPFQYTMLIWAILFGYLVFGDVPKPHMLLGGAVIVGAGLFILFRKKRSRAGRPGEVVTVA